MSIAACYLCGCKKNSRVCVKNGYNIEKCSMCGFIFVSNVPNRTVIDKFYKRFDYQDPLSAEKRIREDAIRSLKHLSNFVSINKKFIDLGCGRGYFMDEARKIGWNPVGIDYSDEVISYAKNVLNLNVLKSDMRAYSSLIKYDVVTLNQFIEHFSDPIKVIRKCHRLLQNNGILYLATPNIESILAKVLMDEFDHIIPPEHLGYYSKNTLTKLLNDCGFKVLLVRSWSYPKDLAGIIKRYFFAKTKNLHHVSQVSHVNAIHNLTLSKKIKYFLFDKIFCQAFYKLLNLNCWGTNLEVIGIKV